MKYVATDVFWESFYDLPSQQKASVRQAWLIFRRDPFDPRLRTHNIHRLSAEYKRTIYAVNVDGDLRVLFYIDGEKVVTLDVGSHDIYRA